MLEEGEAKRKANLSSVACQRKRDSSEIGLYENVVPCSALVCYLLHVAAQEEDIWLD